MEGNAMKNKGKLLAALLAVTMLICLAGFTANAAAEAMSIAFSKTFDAKVRVGYAITREAVTAPECLTVTYTSSDPAVATVNESGRVVGKKPGKAVITASAGGLKTSYNVTVVEADNAAASTKVFEGFPVTVLDQTTPAVTMRGRADDRSVMCFVSAANIEVGVISYSDFQAIISKNKVVVQLEGGGTLNVPPDGRSSWNEWLADEFNKFRGLGAGSREKAVETHTTEIIEEYRQEMIRLVNAEREKVGLSPYIINDKCMAYSQIRAEELVTLFSHTRPDGTNAGYEICTAKGNTPAEAIKAWMESTGHRAAILNADRAYVGAGCYITSTGGVYWQMFFALGRVDTIG